VAQKIPDDQEYAFQDRNRAGFSAYLHPPADRRGPGVTISEFFLEPEKNPPMFLPQRPGPDHYRDGSKLGYSYEGLALEMKKKSGNRSF